MPANPMACRRRFWIPVHSARWAGGRRLTSEPPWERPTPGSCSRSSRRTPRMHARLYRALYRIRRLEEEIARVYPSDKIKSPVHLSIGQEAVSVGVCEALLPQDVVFGTYRGHALYLAKGGDMRAMVAELFGRAAG